MIYRFEVQYFNGIYKLSLMIFMSYFQRSFQMDSGMILFILAIRDIGGLIS